jgi:F-type H+-transporting ATPase subunit epsilon
MAIQLDIVTPEKKIFSDEVDGVVIPGIEGEMGVLPQHAPLVTALAPGELRYTKNAKEEELAIGQGFVEVTANKVAVLTDMAVSDDEIDEAAVEEALERAQKSLQEKLTDEEVAATQAAIMKSLAQLHLKRKRRRV